MSMNIAARYLKPGQIITHDGRPRVISDVYFCNGVNGREEILVGGPALKSACAIKIVFDDSEAILQHPSANFEIRTTD